MCIIATKYLPRTIIEIGRTASSKFGRRRLRRKERHDARKWCHDRLRDENEAYDDAPPEPLRLKKDSSFEQDDNLGPAKRWLTSKIGEPWSDVFSKLSVWTRSGNIAISHVVDSHMLPWVQQPGEKDPPYNFFDFAVDKNGILQDKTDKTVYPKYSWGISSKNRSLLAQAKLWLGDRMVLKRGRHFFWGELIRRQRLCIFCRHSHLEEEHKHYRQAKRLTKKELAFFLNIPVHLRTILLREQLESRKKSPCPK